MGTEKNIHKMNAVHNGFLLGNIALAQCSVLVLKGISMYLMADYPIMANVLSVRSKKIVEPEIKHLFRGVHMYNDDFDASLSKWDFNQNDFMFLDSPYDFKFTDYDNNGFEKKEHIRLKETLQKCNCNWLMAIGKTDFIADLYKEYNIAEYDKTYMYQARIEYLKILT